MQFSLTSRGVLLFVLLAAFAQLVFPLSPPAFPGQGAEFSLQFASTSQVDQVPAGSIALLALSSDASQVNTSVVVQEGAVARVYLPIAGAFNMTAQIDDPSTPSSVDFISGPVFVAEGTRSAELPVAPAGMASGSISAPNGSPVAANLTAHCAVLPSATFSAQSSANGAFQLALPEGNCTIFASSAQGNGNTTVSVPRGGVMTVTFSVAQSITGGTGLQLPNPMLILAALVVVAFVLALAFAYIFFFKKDKDEKEGKGAKGALPAVLLLFAVLASASAASTVSLTLSNSTHNYDLLAQLGYVPYAKNAVVSGMMEYTSGCRGTLAIELSDDGTRFAQVGSTEVGPGDSFSIQLSNPGRHAFYRIRSDPCTIRQSAINFTEVPDLVLYSLNVSSLDPSGEFKTGIEAVITAEVQNNGGPLNSSITNAVVLQFYEGALGSQHSIGEIRIPPSDNLWSEKGSTIKSISWVPTMTGTRILYAAVQDSPDTPGFEASEENNNASIGVFVHPGPSERRATSIRVRITPLTVELSGSPQPNVSISAEYIDSLTQQPIVGALCTALVPSLSNGSMLLSGNAAAYVAVLNTSGLSVGVYSVAVSCSKEGYAHASGSSAVPFVTGGGQVVELDSSGALAHGSIISAKQAFGGMRRLRIVVERFSTHELSVGLDTVKMNNNPASNFSSDAVQEGSGYWLKSPATSAEWLFDFDRISGESLIISFDPRLREGVDGAGARISVRFIPLSASCYKRQPEVAIAPATQSGEVGTPLVYQVTIRNKDTEDCGPSAFTVLVPEGETRSGWRYEFSSTQVVVQPGEINSTFITVTPPTGEATGEYKFKVEVRSSPPAGQSDAPEAVRADARYRVSSPRLRAFLQVSTTGTPPDPVAFTAAYTDSNGNQIGSCHLTSALVGGKSVEMLRSTSSSTLSVPTSYIAPGTYQYVISCEELGFNTKTSSGNVVVFDGPTSRRPALRVLPLAQSPPQGDTLSYSFKISPVGCTSQVFNVSVAPPRGFTASLDRDTVSGCGDAVGTIRLISGNQSIMQPLIGRVTISAPNAPPAVSRFIVNPPDIVAETKSCSTGDTNEAASSLLFSGDPCWSWGDTHTYNLSVSSRDRTMVVAKTFLSGCTQPLLIEFGNASVFSEAVAVVPSQPNEFNFSATEREFTALRISSRCLLETSAVIISRGRQQAIPELSIASVDFNSRMVSGSGSQATVAVRNAGASIYSSYTVSASLVDVSGAKTAIGTQTVYSHARNSDQRVQVLLQPRSSGTYQLLFAVDSASEITEASESNNELIAGDVVVSGAGSTGRITHTLQKGWNLIPFASGAPYTHTCVLSDAYAFSPATNASIVPSLIPLNTSTLSFASPESGQEFVLTHGTALQPKTAAAFGGAWVFASTTCQTIAETQIPSGAWRMLSPGLNLMTVLPGDVGNTVSNLVGACEITRVASWDAGRQEWRMLGNSTVISDEFEGSVLLLEAQGACLVG